MGGPCPRMLTESRMGRRTAGRSACASASRGRGQRSSSACIFGVPAALSRNAAAKGVDFCRNGFQPSPGARAGEITARMLVCGGRRARSCRDKRSCHPREPGASCSTLCAAMRLRGWCLAAAAAACARRGIHPAAAAARQPRECNCSTPTPTLSSARGEPKHWLLD